MEMHLLSDAISDVHVLFLNFYRPQTKFAKVMFLQVSVCPQGVLSQHALQVVSQQALWRGDACSREGGLVETPGWLLLRAVRILLECILVNNLLHSLNSASHLVNLLLSTQPIIFFSVYTIFFIPG